MPHRCWSKPGNNVAHGPGSGQVSTGAAVVIDGTVVESLGKGQKVEVAATCIRVVGTACQVMRMLATSSKAFWTFVA
jgi:aspartyl/asparaginyl-tRNA synthetase